MTDAKGKSFVVIAGPFDASAEAWRWIDRQSGSPVSRSEAVTDWLIHKD